MKSNLTYEQAKAALALGATIRGVSPGIGTVRRGTGASAVKSYDGGVSWLDGDNHDGMSDLDGAYELVSAEASRAEIRRLRDLVELRTLERDEARDDAAQHLLDYESASAQATRFAERLGEQARASRQDDLSAYPGAFVWPGVGVIVSGGLAWDHMMACPRARYLARSGWSGKESVLRSGHSWGEPALSTPDGYTLFADKRALTSDWTFTRLPDAGQEK